MVSDYTLCYKCFYGSSKARKLKQGDKIIIEKPTTEQCETNEKVYDDGAKVGYAVECPTTGDCLVVVFDKHNTGNSTDFIIHGACCGVDNTEADISRLIDFGKTIVELSDKVEAERNQAKTP